MTSQLGEAFGSYIRVLLFIVLYPYSVHSIIIQALAIDDTRWKIQFVSVHYICNLYIYVALENRGGWKELCH